MHVCTCICIDAFTRARSFYCRGARAAIICFDLTDKASFDSLSTKWIRKVVEEAEPGCHICIVGTKDKDGFAAGGRSRGEPVCRDVGRGREAGIIIQLPNLLRGLWIE